MKKTSKTSKTTPENKSSFEDLLKNAEEQQASYNKRKEEETDTEEETNDSCNLDDDFCESCSG